MPEPHQVTFMSQRKLREAEETGAYKSLFCRMCHTVCPHLNYLQHLCPADVAIAVQVVHAESPAQLLFQPASRRHAQGDDELPEVDGGVAVGVERAEDMLGKLRGVSVGEEVGVDLFELLHSQVAGGTVLEEAAVPLL